ncbi:hypothetical protein ACFLZ5_07365 [Thermodesulfobacteriota bacterium]
MSEYKNDVYEQEMVSLRKAFTGFLVGTGAILSMWFFSGIYFVILK